MSATDLISDTIDPYNECYRRYLLFLSLAGSLAALLGQGRRLPYTENVPFMSMGATPAWDGDNSTLFFSSARPSPVSKSTKLGRGGGHRRIRRGKTQ